VKRPFIAGLRFSDLSVARAGRAPKAFERAPMLLTGGRGELFLPDPMHGFVWVLSTPELKLVRKIPARLGVRKVAVDEARNLLLSLSFLSGYVDVVSLDTGKVISSHFVGKYGRAMALDTKRRRAYITLTGDGLFALDY
jgi:hypothetical protein